ncbi:archaeosine biosynthesis radical SAM protein RaSEA [Geoglobus acetivorans]|uniref:Archaeosine biosynthesis radical SAM protein RaSEA n=1 Tax=Geoglobus acetivorans TaxID=565033 RepID=A0ABZ3H388_GEOAI|nr:archaeosine biosynthesis radical SAM protein RaSEA [Geoglobus acetivorans]
MKAWIERERLDGEVVDCLTVILPTRGCGWDKCYMCSYTLDSDRNATQETVYRAFEKAAGKKQVEVLKIFTSGSFFDEGEVERETREKIYRRAVELGFRKLVVESRPEFLTEAVVEEISQADIEIEIGIGLETSNDFYREHLINKGFSFEEYRNAVERVGSVARIKTYLLLKPPLLTEKEAMEDMKKSIEDVKPYTDVVSLNLMTIHSGTYVEKLWREGVYRPPWLWSAVEILKWADLDILCDPVAGGKRRGPHNCFKCDSSVVDEIRRFSLTGDKGVFETDCECKEKWKLALEAEDLIEKPLFP